MTKWQTEALETMLDEGLDDKELRKRIGNNQEALDELMWLRAEREIFAARKPVASSALFEGVMAELRRTAVSAKPPKERFWARLWPKWPVAFGGLALAGAALVLLLVVREPDPATGIASVPGDTAVAEVAPDDPLDRANEALVEAQLVLGEAMTMLETAYAEKKSDFSDEAIARLERDFEQTRALLREGQTPDFQGANARHRLLSASFVRLRTLRSALIHEEQTP